MCLSDVYRQTPSGEAFFLKNIAKAENRGDSVIFTDLLGRQTEIKAEITDIDLLENIIRIREREKI